MKDFQVRPGRKVRLKERDAKDTAFFKGTRDSAKKLTEDLTQKLGRLQHIFYADGRHKLLVVLQAMDTAGKDGTIRHVFDHVNPQGIRVYNFKVPTAEELSHDFLWRVHPKTPGLGEISIFNRSHYEDVLITRVHGLVPQALWKKRYGHINEFERLLSDEGTTVLKFFLHISRDEQKKRLEARLDDPKKRWKFNPGDLAERKLWDRYREAYEDSLTKTSTPWAPWHVIPSDHKWFRNWAVARILTEKLESLGLKYPKPAFSSKLKI